MHRYIQVYLPVALRVRRERRIPHASNPRFPSRFYSNLRHTPRLAMLVALLACGALIRFACAYWLFTTRYSHLSPSVRILLGSLIRSYVVNASQHTTSELTIPHVPPQDPTTSHQPDITFDLTNPRHV
ncbi:hypothetical protein J3R83DRAFT_7545 [Lanmaoa asiatica]|nr:hypothetical protein J3R83DRAFT_7545 [Lanmaoa asiatica]